MDTKKTLRGVGIGALVGIFATGMYFQPLNIDAASISPTSITLETREEILKKFIESTKALDSEIITFTEALDSNPVDTEKVKTHIATSKKTIIEDEDFIEHEENMMQVLLGANSFLHIDALNAALSNNIELQAELDAIEKSFEEVKQEELARIEAERIEQDRIERERIAAEEAPVAAVAATQASTQRYNPLATQVSGSPALPHAPQAFNLRVGGSGSQAEIDRCIGAIWEHHTPNYLAEHWHCGGAAFPKNSGALVNVPGAGLYEVIGIVNVVSDKWATTGDIPGGYDLIYQTCLNNNPDTMAMIALKRIG